MVPISNKISRSYARLLHNTHRTAISGALVVAMVNIVALRLCGLLPRLKLIDLFVKVDLCAHVRAVAQTTQPKSGLSRFPPRLECVTSRPRVSGVRALVAAFAGAAFDASLYPVAGIGAADVYRVRSPREMEQVLRAPERLGCGANFIA